jgi:hypothetical protein
MGDFTSMGDFTLHVTGLGVCSWFVPEKSLSNIITDIIGERSKISVKEEQ